MLRHGHCIGCCPVLHLQLTHYSSVYNSVHMHNRSTIYWMEKSVANFCESEHKLVRHASLAEQLVLETTGVVFRALLYPPLQLTCSLVFHCKSSWWRFIAQSFTFVKLYYFWFHLCKVWLVLGTFFASCHFVSRINWAFLLGLDNVKIKREIKKLKKKKYEISKEILQEISKLNGKNT